jgi:hypothetical protein
MKIGHRLNQLTGFVSRVIGGTQSFHVPRQHPEQPKIHLHDLTRLPLFSPSRFIRMDIHPCPDNANSPLWDAVFNSLQRESHGRYVPEYPWAYDRLESVCGPIHKDDCLYRSDQTLTLLHSFALNSGGRVYDGEVTPSLQATPYLILDYFHSGHSFCEILHDRRDLGLRILDVLKIWLPDSKWETRAIEEVGDHIMIVYGIECATAYDREFIEVQLKNDRNLIREYYERDPRYPDDPPFSDDEEDDSTDDEISDDDGDENGGRYAHRTSTLEPIPEENEEILSS